MAAASSPSEPTTRSTPKLPGTSTSASASQSASPGLSAPATDSWSSLVDGVRARLVLTESRDTKGRPQLAIDVDLDNRDVAAKEVWWGTPWSNLELSLKDESGVALPELAPGGSYADAPRWIALPIGTTRVHITSNAYEYVPGGRTLLRPTTFRAWDMPAKRASKLYLHGKVVPLASDDQAHHPWTGTMDLPRVLLP